MATPSSVGLINDTPSIPEKADASHDSDVYKPLVPGTRASSSSSPSSSAAIDHSNKATSSSKRRTCRWKNILEFPSLILGTMPNEVSPSPAGPSPVNIPSSSRLPDVDLTHSLTTSKAPFNSFPLVSPTPSLSSLTRAQSEMPDDPDNRLFTRSARFLDLFVEDLEISLKRYHSVNFDARLLLKDYGFQEGMLHQRSPDFQAGLLAILGRWETPHVEGFWLTSLNEELKVYYEQPACPEVLTISHRGEDLFTFSHTYLLQLGHVVLALHQILSELSVLKEDLKSFVFDPNFKSLWSLEGVPDSYLLQATWGVLMFRTKQACERINNELRTLCVILGQHDDLSIHSNDSTLSDLLQRDDYRNGIPPSVQGLVKHWLQQLPAPLPFVPACSYRSETEKSMVAPSVLPSITTPHPVQVHFAMTLSLSLVYVPEYGAVEDSHGVGLSSDPNLNLPPSPRYDSPTGLQPLILPSRTHSMDRPLPSLSYLQSANWSAPAKEVTQYGNYPSSTRSSNKCIDDDNRGQLPTCSQSKTSAPYQRNLNDSSNDNSGRRGGSGGGPGAMVVEDQVVTVEDLEDLEEVQVATEEGRYDPPPPPGPNNPDGGGNPPNPPPPAGNMPVFFPRPPANFRWQLSSKIPLLSLPEWNGSPTTVIQYVSELSYYQQLGDEVTNHLARVAPFRFTGLAKTWFNGLSLTDRLACTANMPNFLIFICEQFMHDEWKYERGLEFDRMYFRWGKEYRNELPIEWVLRRISYARLLYPEEAEVEPLVCSRVLARRPRSWGTYILSEHSQTIRELLKRVNSEQPRLLYAWERERKEAIENDKVTRPANSRQQSALLITTSLDDDIDSVSPHLHEFLESEAEPAEALAVDRRRKQSKQSQPTIWKTHYDWPNGKTFEGHSFSRDNSQHSCSKPLGECRLCSSPFHFYRECPHFPMWVTITKRLRAQGQHDPKDLRKLEHEYEAHIASLQIDESDDSSSNYAASEINEKDVNKGKEVIKASQVSSHVAQDPSSPLTSLIKTQSAKGSPSLGLETLENHILPLPRSQLTEATTTEEPTLTVAAKVRSQAPGFNTQGIHSLRIKASVVSPNETTIYAHLDSGADITLMSQNYWETIPQILQPPLRTGSKSPLSYLPDTPIAVIASKSSTITAGHCFNQPVILPNEAKEAWFVGSSVITEDGLNLLAAPPTLLTSSMPYLPIANPSTRPLHINKGDIVGYAFDPASHFDTPSTTDRWDLLHAHALWKTPEAIPQRPPPSPTPSNSSERWGPKTTATPEDDSPDDIMNTVHLGPDIPAEFRPALEDVLQK
ncbi:hypothetical protein BDN71DRAFT_1511013 [Pleurotus eryngii]|uniref:Peptidase A2 domain-containing protein n=1 Tax=Pleurotus eryngii TaxID=5323 RepID=A0A9P5ZS02_PLEER|nr:hypothetical protein BDN71DRAFT_1511013 [Pleurotus eryngii]